MIFALAVILVVTHALLFCAGFLVQNRATRRSLDLAERAIKIAQACFEDAERWKAIATGVKA